MRNQPLPLFVSLLRVEPGVKEYYCPQNNTAEGKYYTGIKLP